MGQRGVGQRAVHGAASQTRACPSTFRLLPWIPPLPWDPGTPQHCLPKAAAHLSPLAPPPP